MDYLLANDAISGKEGRVIMSSGGRTRICAEIKSLSAKMDKTKREFKALGHRGTQHKATGWVGTGSVTFYYVSSQWAQMMVSYAKTGKDVYFDMVVINEDPSSSVGRQEVQLMQCNIDGADIAKVDAEADWLDAAFNFTFSDVDMPQPFDLI